jgi:hypothetical protein
MSALHLLHFSSLGRNDRCSQSPGLANSSAGIRRALAKQPQASLLLSALAVLKVRNHKLCRGACNFYVRGGQTKKPEQLQKATRKDSHSEFRIYHCVHGPEDDSVPCVFLLVSPSHCSNCPASSAAV